MNKTRTRGKEPKCQSCSYMLPSESVSTELRCGFKYFKSLALFQKINFKHDYPEVIASKECESWKSSKFDRLENW